MDRLMSDFKMIREPDSVSGQVSVSESGPESVSGSESVSGQVSGSESGSHLNRMLLMMKQMRTWMNWPMT